MALTRLLYLSTSIALLAVTRADAYEVVPHAAAQGLGFEPVHEAMTLASLACANQALAGAFTTGRSTLDCSGFSKNLGELGNAYLAYRGKKTRDLRSPSGSSYDLDEVREIIDGVLWPDDPTRLHSSPTREGRALVNHFHVCTKLQNEYLSCANRYCMSHFGNLQFLHAMIPAAPWCEKDKGRSDSPTCELAQKPVKEGMEQWVKWLVPLAKGETHATDPLFPGEDGFTQRVFDQRYCNRESGFWLWKTLPMYPNSMKIEELLYTSCDEVGAGKCRVVLPVADKERRTQRLAMGALLHLIQDSYAQGHTRRRPIDKRLAGSAFVACSPVEDFHDYRVQVQDKKALDAHKSADKYPAWDSSCSAADRQVDDPVTAGANLIVMLRNPNQTGQHVWDYLRLRVLGPKE